MPVFHLKPTQRVWYGVVQDIRSYGNTSDSHLCAIIRQNAHSFGKVHTRSAKQAHNKQERDLDDVEKAEDKRNYSHNHRSHNPWQGSLFPFASWSHPVTVCSKPPTATEETATTHTNRATQRPPLICSNQDEQLRIFPRRKSVWLSTRAKTPRLYTCEIHEEHTNQVLTQCSDTVQSR